MAMDRRPLVEYLKVQERWEAKQLILLRQAAADVEKDIRKIGDRQNVGSKMRRSQLLQVRKAIHEQMGDLWKTIGSNVAADREKAAAAAIHATFEQNDILKRVPGMTPTRLTRLEAAAAQTAQRGLTTAMQRVQGTSYIPLSDAVYGSQRLASGQVDRLVTSALVRGLSARELAQQVRNLIRPDVRGGVSYAAMRLGRTELNNAFHSTQVMEGIREPWITGLRWNLSSSHPENDECDSYADRVFEPERVPHKPHPMCLCFMTTESLTAAQMMNDPASMRHIDKMMRDAGYSTEEIARSR